MTGTVLISPLPFIDPAKPKDKETKKAEESQDKMLHYLVDLITKHEVPVEITVKELIPDAKISDNHPFRQQYTEVPAITILSHKPFRECFEERMEVVRTLTERGYDVRVLAPTDKFHRYQRGYFISKALDMGAKALDTCENNLELIDWCRDSQMQIGDAVYLSPLSHDDWFAKLGHNGKRKVSPLGEGGLTVVSDNFILTSDQTSEEELRSVKEDIPRYHTLREGIKLQKYYYKNGEAINLDLAAMTQHVDIFVNVIPQERLLVVDYGYYADNRNKLNKIAKKERYKIIKTSPNESYLAPTNYLDLPDGMVLINDSNSLYEGLKTNGFAENVIRMPKKLHHNFEALSGSIRCFTNTLKSP